MSHDFILGKDFMYVCGYNINTDTLEAVLPSEIKTKSRLNSNELWHGNAKAVKFEKKENVENQMLGIVTNENETKQETV